MVELVVRGGTVLTQDDDRRVIRDGSVAIDDGRIVAVGPASAVEDAHDASRVVDARGQLVVPGFVDAHAHVSDVLLRGYSGEGRGLFDWLYNVKSPGLAAMDADDHALAAALFCREATAAGVTTVVENDLEGGWQSGKPEAKLDVYDAAGLRVVYARGFLDAAPGGEFERFLDRVTAKEPTVAHVDPADLVEDVDDVLDHVDALLAADHGDERVSIAIAPAVVEGTTTAGLVAAREFATDRGLLTTTHVAETAMQAGDGLSAVEYLDNVDYLAEGTLLGHCVHVDERDLRLLAGSGASVAHNLATNLRLGSGLAPVEAMRARGVPVGLGTDNASCSDSVNPLADLRLVALTHDGHHRDPGRVTAQAALDMATREGARAVGLGDEVGSLEPGKRADVVTVDLDGPHLSPRPDPVSALVYQTHGTEVSTVVCGGEVVVSPETDPVLDDDYPDLLATVRRRSAELAERVGLSTAGGRASNRR